MSLREPSQRQSMRLSKFNYAHTGYYFVTLCTHQRQYLFGTIRAGCVKESAAGLMVQKNWAALPERFPFIALDAFVVMPNHLHGLLHLTEQAGEQVQASSQSAAGYHHPNGTSEYTLGRVVQAFKSLTVHYYIQGVRQGGWPPFDGQVWPRNYHDHIVRDTAALDNLRSYIAANPYKWDQDEENPQAENQKM